MNDVTRRPPPAARPGGTGPVDPASARPAGGHLAPGAPGALGAAGPTGAAEGPGAGQVAGLQAALAAEHAVVWGYGVVGGRADAGLLPAVREADQAHRGRRDGTAALVRRYGGEPVPTEASYELPFPVPDRRAALRLAVHLEEGAAAAWRYAVAATDDRSVRRAALAALTDAAVRATRWRLLLPPPDGVPATVPFPGGDG